MNSPSEGQRANLALPEAAGITGRAAARLQYRALADEELEFTQTATGDRRRRDRRMVAKAAAAGGVLSEEAVQQALKAANAEGFQRGEREGRGRARTEAEAEMHAADERQREHVAQALEIFAESKRRYFAEIEGQVVRLALAIASRVLHRETQMDALVLSGAVRVALDKLAERSGVVLRVALTDVPAWEKMLAGMERSDTPKVMGDRGLGRGDCSIEAAMGTVELGVSTQLEEIEKGFFDLLSLNPQAAEARV